MCTYIYICMYVYTYTFTHMYTKHACMHRSCHHKWSLLDADQEIPWADQPLVFHHKWRVWVQPYNETYHQPIRYGGDTALLIGSLWEYDVPVCKEGVAGTKLACFAAENIKRAENNNCSQIKLHNSVLFSLYNNKRFIDI